MTLDLRFWSKSVHLHDVRALALLPALKAGYVPWTSSSLRPGAVRAILNEVIVNRRTTVLECGSGISSLYVARELMKVGGKLVSIENDDEWITIVRELSLREGISEDALEFIHAPLEELTLEGVTSRWYDRRIVENRLLGGMFDVLVVDGPLAGGSAGRNSRLPALQFLAPHMRDDACIFIDDIHRRAERRLAQRWSRDYHMHLSLRPIESGVAVLHSEGMEPRNIW